MSIVIALCVVVLAVAVAYVVSAPLRRSAGESAAPARGRGPGELAHGATRDDLLAAREAKYREIRDAELDFRTGKLSRADYDTLDAELRAEAIEILDRIEALDEHA